MCLPSAAMCVNGLEEKEPVRAVPGQDPKCDHSRVISTNVVNWNYGLTFLRDEAKLSHHSKRSKRKSNPLRQNHGQKDKKNSKARMMCGVALGNSN